MNEALEAEIFNRELTGLLTGTAGPGAEGEVAKDLLFAARLCLSDYSAESRVRRKLKAELLSRQEASLPRRRFWRISVRPTMIATCAGLALLFLVPFAIDWYNNVGSSEGTFKEGWGLSEGGASLGKGSSPYEAGLNGLAPGTMAGENGDVITPLETHDPSSLITDSGQNLQKFNREGYDHIVENTFQRTADHPLSTFSIDVDAASYANVRRILGEGKLPPKDAVRVEEMINYFHYDYPEPKGKEPISITAELADCPWNSAHKLVRIGLKGRSIPKKKLPPNNLVFLIDSSGSMLVDEKLPLLKRAFRLLVEELRPEDHVTIVTYAGAAGLVLPSTSGKDKETILTALDKIDGGGSTAGGDGIVLAYKKAAESYIKGGVNRVILATDGDFNVGVTSDGELVRLMEDEREKGVFITILGFGQENYQDSKMKKVADAGRGNYAYIDDIVEARRVLVQQMGETLTAIAKDVKIQVEFNPAHAQSYRLIGYESRLLKAEDFNNDKKDAGTLGAGHCVTALYEVIPPGVDDGLPLVDPLKYQTTKPAAEAAASPELLTVKFRYKEPDGDKSRLITHILENKAMPWGEAPQDFKFAAAAAGFGMLLHGSAAAGDLTYAKVVSMASEGVGKDDGGYRAEMVRLAEKAQLLNEGPHPLR